jgi:DNA-binding ferritin-like protein
LTFKQRSNIPPQKYTDLKTLLDHIKKYHCSNDDKHFDFFIQFFANIIQTPQSVPQIILVFYSPKHGTGKSMLTRFISEVIGNPLSFFGSLKQISETHTNAHLGKLLNIIEEVDNHSTKFFENVIKDYSQRFIAALNQKNKDIIQIKTFIRYIFTSNHYNGVYFDSEDRRYCVYTFDKISDKNYIDLIQTLLKDNYVKYLFGKYLEEYNITYHNPNDWNQNRTKTPDYYNMMIEDSLKNFLKEIYANDILNLLEEDFSDFHLDQNDKKFILIHHKKFNELYKEFCKENNEKIEKISNVHKQLTSTYKKIFKIKKVKNRKYHHVNLFELGIHLNLNKLINNYNLYTDPNYISEKIDETKNIIEI